MDSEMHDCSVPRDGDIEGHVPSSNPSPSPPRRRGPSLGPPKLPEGQMRFIATNEYGVPNKMDENTKFLQSDIGLQVRDTLPVGYEDFTKIPVKPVADVMDALKKTFVLKYVKASWLDQKIKKAWRDKKFKLRKKYITGNNPTEVKCGKTPSFVTTEDWHKFIDLSTTPKFEAESKRNTINRSKLEMPYAAGRHSIAQIRHKIAKEKNLASDSEVGRTESFIATHTKKDKTEQCPEKMNKMRSIMDTNPEARRTGVNDALVQTLGKDSRGRSRGLPPGISSSFMNDSAEMVNKLVDSQQQNARNELEIEKMNIRLDDLTEKVTKFVDSPRQNTINVDSPCSTSSLTPSPLPQHQDISDIGKKCDVYGWGDVLVAHGEVVAVDPSTVVHNVKMGNGNYKISIESAEDEGFGLFRPNSQVTVIYDVVGSYTVWPKTYLKFVH